MPEPQSEDPVVAALLRERAGLVQRGLDPRVAQVDEQLAARGYATAEAAPPQEDATEPPKGRQVKSRSRAAE